MTDSDNICPICGSRPLRDEKGDMSIQPELMDKTIEPFKCCVRCFVLLGIAMNEVIKANEKNVIEMVKEQSRREDRERKKK
jgi:hypothetical protein